jgi:hypothetical protein
MPVETCISEDGSLVVFRFHELVTAQQVLTACTETATGIDRNGRFSSLLLFEAGVDLSDIDAEAINAIRLHREREFRDYGLTRHAGAAVVDGSLDARLVLKLWNALSDCDPEFDLSFKLFDKAGPALEWLGIPAARARPVVEQTGFRLRL